MIPLMQLPPISKIGIARRVFRSTLVWPAALLLAGLAWSSTVSWAEVIGTGFTYQGQLTENGQPAAGSYNFRFALYDQEARGQTVAQPLLMNAVEVNNGLFTVVLNFNQDVLGAYSRGDALWLEIGVDRRGTNFTTLLPRQALTPAPYANFAHYAGAAATAQTAMTATSIPASGITGTLADTRLPFNMARLVGVDCKVGPESASIAGGIRNTNFAQGAFLGGGVENQIQSNAAYSTLMGGYHNTNGGTYAVVLGGAENATRGEYSLAAGRRAKANHSGTFIWADSQSADFASTGDNQFLIRASGGVALGTNNPAGAALNVLGAVRAVEFEGSGANLTNLKAANLAAGNIASAVNLVSSTGVGIGTSNPEDCILDVEGNIHLNNFDLFLRGGSDRAHGLGYYGPSKKFAGIGVEGPVLYGSLAGGLGTTYPSPNLALTWTSTGNIGIGTAAPIWPLDVRAGQAVGRFISTNSTAVSFLELRNTSTSATLLGAINFNDGNNSTPGQIAYSTSQGLTFRTGSSERLRLGETNGSAFLALQGNYSQILLGNHTILSYPGGGAPGFGSIPPSITFRINENVMIVSENNGAGSVQVHGPIYATAFNTISDRDQKENFTPVDTRGVLDQVSALPITKWNFKGDPANPHVGPTAQDFRAAFQTGADDKHIATVDADGVALAAIQGLHQLVKEKEAQITALEQRLAALEQLVKSQAR